MTLYIPLARKYRPKILSDLVGQDLLVKVLSNCFKTKKIPQAFLFHGIRGVGKTTSARIIAKALNCLGEDYLNKPCNECASCSSVDHDRHIDVIEIDAASRTGVDDIREIIDTLQYKAVQGLYRIYIIDEVHMLSKSAFNALLKTLEEPPSHVKFIFATTEIKKIPDTILSRCMRFDLKSLDSSAIIKLLKGVSEKEGFKIAEDGSLNLIASAAQGSARDALSLLDQAALLGEGAIELVQVREMLGLADPEIMLQLVQDILLRKSEKTLSNVKQAFLLGASPLTLLDQILTEIYKLTCIKKIPSSAKDIAHSYNESFLNALEVSKLMQSWQVLMKGREEVILSTHPEQALEMVLLRLLYLSDLPQASDLLSFIQQLPQDNKAEVVPIKPLPKLDSLAMSSIPPQVATSNDGIKKPQTFEELGSFIKQAKEPLLYGHFVHDIQLIDFSPPHIKVVILPTAPKNFLKDLQHLLGKLGLDWQLIPQDNLSHQGLSLAEQDKRKEEQNARAALSHPTIEQIRTHFPDAEIKVQH